MLIFSLKYKALLFKLFEVLFFCRNIRRNKTLHFKKYTEISFVRLLSGPINCGLYTESFLLSSDLNSGMLLYVKQSKLDIHYQLT